MASNTGSRTGSRTASTSVTTSQASAMKPGWETEQSTTSSSSLVGTTSVAWVSRLSMSLFKGSELRRAGLGRH